MTNDWAERVGCTRRVTLPWSTDGTRGVTSTHLDELLDRWANGYDWALHERRIGELAWATLAAGGTVAEILAAEHPDKVAALHLTDVSPRHALTADPAKLAPDAAAYLGQAAQWFRTEGGYIAEQSTRPNTLTVALGDSPAGLLAWIVEKLEAWSGESAFTPDELLTWVTAYWVTGTIGTSFATYTEPAAVPGRIETPTVLSVFSRDIKPAPRSYAEAFLNVCDYVEHRAGGHFAAWEQPEAYADDVRRAVKLGR